MKILVPVTVPAYAEVEVSAEKAKEVRESWEELKILKNGTHQYSREEIEQRIENELNRFARDMFSGFPRDYVIIGEGSRGIADPKDAVIQ